MKEFTTEFINIMVKNKIWRILEGDSFYLHIKIIKTGKEKYIKRR